MQIRRYEQKDRPFVDEICLRTGDAGKDATGKHADDQLLSYIYALPYVDYAPQWAWVASEEDKVVGYIIAVPDTAQFRAWWQKEWVPRLQDRFREEVRSTWPARDRAMFEEAVAGEKRPPAWEAEYPAELHIDILPEGQGQGLGRKLIDTLFTQLREEGVPGLALGVGGSNKGAIGFYERLGFEVLSASYENGRLLGQTMGKKV